MSQFLPQPSDKFAFGIWGVQNRGRDPFGEATRPSLSALDAIRGLALRGCYGFEFHDNDLFPFDATLQQKDEAIRQVKAVMAETGIRATMATTNLFFHPVFRDGAFTSCDPAVRAFAVKKVMHCLDLAAELGAGVFVFWGGREGLEVDAAKDPITCAKWFRDAINFLCEYVLENRYDIRFSLEPKPNEPRGDLYLPTVGSMLAFIATLDHAEMVGVNPETAHIKMAGLNPYHEFAQALDAGKLFDVHLNGQKPLRFDQDLSFGSDDLREAFFTMKLLMDHDYSGTLGFDCHPYRTESAPWDFVERNLRMAKIMQSKVHQFNSHMEIQSLWREIHGAHPEWDGAYGKFSPSAAARIKSAEFVPDRLAEKRLPYERLDQLFTELLLGVL